MVGRRVERVGKQWKRKRRRRSSGMEGPRMLRSVSSSFRIQSLWDCVCFVKYLLNTRH